MHLDNKFQDKDIYSCYFSPLFLSLWEAVVANVAAGYVIAPII